MHKVFLLLREDTVLSNIVTDCWRLGCFFFFLFFFPLREFSPICYLRDGTDGYNGYVRETKDVAKMEARVQLAAVS